MRPSPVRRLPMVFLASCAIALTHAPDARAGRTTFDLRGLEPAVDSIVSPAMRQGPIAGVSVAIAVRGKVVFAKAYGVTDLDSRRPVTNWTVFPLCSISKHIAAVAILAGDGMHLADLARAESDTTGSSRGYVLPRLQVIRDTTMSEPFAIHHLVARVPELTDTVGALLPETPRAWHGITVRQLLTHTSGLGSYNDPALGWDSLCTRPLSHAEILSLAADQPLAFVPGSSWGYSNTAFYLLGMVVEKASGHSYGEYIRERIGERYGAPSLRAVVDWIGARAHGYRLSGDSLVSAEREDWANPFAGGGLAATAPDLALWEGSRSWDRLLAAPTILSDGTAIDYGFGTRLGRLGSHRMAGHTGNGNGFNNVLVKFPDDDLVIVVLTNSESRVSAHAIEAGIARHLLRVPDTPPIDLPVPKYEAAADTGVWSGDSRTIEVFAAGDRVRWRGLGEPGDGRPLASQGDGVFVVAPGYTVRFLPNGIRARWAQTYAEGLFGEAMHRVR